MNLDDYQQAALRTTNPALDNTARLMDAAAGLAEEAGEVLGLVRKHVYQHRELDSLELKHELGDALWCLAVAAHAAGFTLESVAQANVAKLRDRHPDGFTEPATPAPRS